MSTAILESEEVLTTTTNAAPILSAGPASPEQGEAWEKFTALPMPVRTNEEWRFANVKDLDLSGYVQSQPVDEATRDDLLARSRGVEAVAGRMVFANDELLAQETLGDSLRQKGVIWLPLDRAAAEHPVLFRKHFMREEAILGGQKFAALHASQVRAGTFLYVPRGIRYLYSAWRVIW